MTEKTKVSTRPKSTAKTADFVLDHDVYAAISVAAELHDIKLVASEYAAKPDIVRVAEDLENMVHGFFGECTSFHFFEESGLAMGQYRWTAEIKSGRKKALKLTADYLVAYANLSGQEEGHVEFFLNKVGRFATYPYFRALFSHHTSETGIMLPPLPSLNERVD